MAALLMAGLAARVRTVALAGTEDHSPRMVMALRPALREAVAAARLALRQSIPVGLERMGRWFSPIRVRPERLLEASSIL